MVLSFADRDMIMCYFGGGVGHLGNAQQHKVNCEPPDSNTEPHRAAPLYRYARNVESYNVSIVSQACFPQKK